MKSKDIASKNHESTSEQKSDSLDLEKPNDSKIRIPKGINLSHRYLSPWSSNQVVIAVGHHRVPKLKPLTLTR